MKLLLKLGSFFTSKKGSKIIEKGMEVTGKNLLYKKIFKISILVVLGILLLAGTINVEVFVELIDELM